MIGKKVLLVDDDTDFLKFASRFFEGAGAQVMTAQGGMEGIRQVLASQPDLIILDIMMPGKDGFQVCQIIRHFSNTPLIMVSALDQDQLLLQGLDAGADDFLTKPVNPDILLARVRAVLRRSEQGNGYQASLKYDDGHLKIDIEKHRVRVKGKLVKLTPVEFRLLVFLLSNSGKVQTFRQILTKVWGSEYLGNDEFVHVYVSHIRSKIEEDTKHPHYILSIHGVGYMFERHV